MSRKSTLLWIQAVLCILLWFLLSRGMARMYMEGVRLNADGQLTEWIFTREKMAGLLKSLIPLFISEFAVLLLSVGIHPAGEDMEKPAGYRKTARKQTGGDSDGMRLMPSEARDTRAARTVRVVLLLAAGALILHGIFNGSMQDVFIKAVKICTECIGLG